VERLRSERFSILRKCRMDGISIALLEGSLSDVPLDDTEVSHTCAHGDWLDVG
jgi:hypothetical protein